METGSEKIYKINKIYPWSPQVLDTLENLIAPGGRARLSPYVEAAQIYKLFETLPTSQKQHIQIRTILNKNADSVKIIAEYWSDFCKSGKRFEQSHYSEKLFLDSYLIYYFSVNVAKLQICLLDLLRESELSYPILNVIDVGLGAATTFTAVLDFLHAWKTVCDLYSTPFPVEQVALDGFDQNPNVIKYANEVLRAYGKSIGKRAEITNDPIISIILESIRSANFHHYDIQDDKFPNINSSPNLVIASNLLSELSDQGKYNLSQYLTVLPQKALVILVEPGDQKRSRGLMKYRSELSRTKRFSHQGPCGQETIGQDNQTCKQCWNSRRHAFHQSELYMAFRHAAVESIKDQRRYDYFENHLLSWSNVWLKRGSPEITEQPGSLKFVGDNWPEDQPLRFIGKYMQQKSGRLSFPQPPRSSEKLSQNGRWVENLKFCPTFVGKEALVLERKPGFQVPVLRHGHLVKLSGVTVQKNESKVLKLQVDKSSQVIPIDSPNSVLKYLPSYNHSTRKAVDEIGYRLFGFPQMHNFQHRILERVLTGRSILGISATGSGKSECFILPAMILSGGTAVVSPLISLMMDQYDQRICERYGLDYLATYINGEVKFEERQARLRRLELGYYKLVYFTPEQLERGYVLDSLRRANVLRGIRYLAMDEAHCISQWGHDFRPSYLNLVRRLLDYGVDPVRIALTATASPYVRRDICEELGLKPEILEEGGDVFVESSNRPELNLIVRVHRDTREKVEGILDDLRNLLLENEEDQEPGTAIVFLPLTGGNPDSKNYSNLSPNRGRLSAGVSLFASYLERQLNQKVSIYHGKMEMVESTEHDNDSPKTLGDMSGRSRRSEQLAFIKGNRPIMVATKGFGMGIDKDNVRLIIHRTPPPNLEAYAQEAGRAGRDGYPADVVLYYSPDAPEEDNDFGKIRNIRSDYEIQSFFLSNKYIRREDVLVMRAFLKSATRRVGKNLYFTNDEAIDFFDRCSYNPPLAGLPNPYQWPDFPAREPFGWESVEHRYILEVGYEYQNKTAYIDRILQVLYRVRPGIENLGPRVPFLEQVQETEAQLYQPQVINARSILDSNIYFGEKLRMADLDQDNLISLLNSDNILPLADLLGQSLYETAAMLRDIRYAEGRFVNDRWIPSLFDFKGIFVPKFGPASGKDSLADWRDYAGAYRRATKSLADKRAIARRRPKKQKRDGQWYLAKELDDWFDWPEVNSCRGWEITPGSAFEADESFDEYLRSFMNLHDQRRENDWSAYRRLLNDYVGVGENGEYHLEWRKGNCLRAVLLGYLETYEVVTGDNCYGCSRCVPDGNFGRYTIDERKSVVIRMLPTMKLSFDRFKSMVDSIPSESEETRLFDEIDREEKAGLSLKAYFSGWSGRMLDQMPGHQAALWLRFAAMGRGLTALQHDEFLEYSSMLLDVIIESDLYRWLDLMQAAKDSAEDIPGYWFQLAKYYQRMGITNEEVECLRSIVNITSTTPLENRVFLNEASTRLVEIFEPEGVAPDPKNYKSSLIMAARTAPEYLTSKEFYQMLISGWDWNQVQQEVDQLENFTSLPEINAALYIGWLNANDLKPIAVLIEHFKNNSELLKNWPIGARQDFYTYLPIQTILDWPEVRGDLLRESKDTEIALGIGLILVAKKEPLPSSVKRRITQMMFSQSDYQRIARLTEELITPEQLCLALDSLYDHADINKWTQVEKWLRLYPENREINSRIASDIIIRANDFKPDGIKALNLLIKLATPLLDDQTVADSLQTILKSLSLDNTQTMKAVLAFIPRLGSAGVNLPDDILKEILKYKKVGWLKELTSISPPTERWRNAQIMVAKTAEADRFIKASERNYDTQRRTLDEICNIYDWQRDGEQADMLALVVYRWMQNLNPNWKTPPAKLVEILVAAGRAQDALEIAKWSGDLFVYWNGRRYDAEKYIRLRDIPQRSTEISADYGIILAELISV